MSKYPLKVIYTLLLILVVAGATFIYQSELSAPSATEMTDFKNYIITLKESASSADINTLKSKIAELGGSITSEYSLIKGFAAKLPTVHSSSIGEHSLVNSIEEDKEVHTQ